jgi:hypothetical protein
VLLLGEAAFRQATVSQSLSHYSSSQVDARLIVMVSFFHL